MKNDDIIITESQKLIKRRAYTSDATRRALKRRLNITVFKENENMNSNNKNLVPEAKEALNRFKMEAASEVGVTLKQGYNGDLTSKQAGSVGGQMVKKMIMDAENAMKNNK